MVVIRLTRTGRKKVANYRVVVADSRKRRDGRIIEKIGDYNPMTSPASFQIDHERALYWLKNGAQVSDTVRSLFHRDGIKKKLELSKKGLDAVTIEIECKPEKQRKAAPSKKSVAKAQQEQEAVKTEAPKEEPKAEAPKEEAKEPPKEEASAEKPAE